MDLAGHAGKDGSLGVLLEAVLEAMAEAVVVFDREGRLAHANGAARAMLGVGKGEEVGPEHLAELLAQGARRISLRAGESVLGEAVLLGVGSPPTLAERERQAILETLRLTGWRQAEAARRLGISRTTLWRRLKAYGFRGRDG
jgi:transcriptional regulator of acetoin/glycerol metabolism